MQLYLLGKRGTVFNASPRNINRLNVMNDTFDRANPPLTESHVFRDNAILMFIILADS
jgi:hypothetical protein